MKTKECNKKTKYLFPEHKETVQQLRETNPHFAKIFEEHATLDKEICHLELDPVQQIHSDIEIKKRRKLKLKDEMYRLIKSESDEAT